MLGHRETDVGIATSSVCCILVDLRRDINNNICSIFATDFVGEDANEGSSDSLEYDKCERPRLTKVLRATK